MIGDSTELIVGQIKVGEEFILDGYVFKRVGTILNNIGPLYDIHRLPYAGLAGLDAYPRDGHQNTIVVQEKLWGGFYFVECYLPCVRADS